MMYTNKFQLVCYVICDDCLCIKPEDWQQDWSEVCIEGANIGIWSQLENDLQSHENLCGNGGALLNCDAGRMLLFLRFETPYNKTKH